MILATFRTSNNPSDRRSAERRRAAAKLLAIKTSGYLISTVSVVLLGILSWKKASEDPVMMACLLGGMLASTAGMFLRWLSYEIEERRKANGEE